MRPLIDLQDDDLPNIDQFYVSEKDPGFHYTWLNKKADNIERMKMLYGFEIIGAKHDEVALAPPNAAGERVVGDLVLARIPKERYEKLQRLRGQRNASRLTTANEEWKEKAAQSGLIPEDSTKTTKSTSLV